MFAKMNYVNSCPSAGSLFKVHWDNLLWGFENLYWPETGDSPWHVTTAMYVPSCLSKMTYFIYNVPVTCYVSNIIIMIPWLAAQNSFYHM